MEEDGPQPTAIEAALYESNKSNKHDTFFSPYFASNACMIALALRQYMISYMILVVHAGAAPAPAATAVAFGAFPLPHGMLVPRSTLPVEQALCPTIEQAPAFISDAQSAARQS